MAEQTAGGATPEIESERVLVLSVWGVEDPTSLRIRIVARPMLPGTDDAIYRTQPDEAVAVVRRWLALVSDQS